MKDLYSKPSVDTNSKTNIIILKSSLRGFGWELRTCHMFKNCTKSAAKNIKLHTNNYLCCCSSAWNIVTGKQTHTCHLNINHSEPDQFKFVSHSNFNNCQFLLSCSDKYNMHTHVHTVATCMFPQGKIILLKLQFINPNFVLILYKKT